MILGTAGHIDHGKSTLVEALTGRRLDSLAEERRRGITIDLHFTALPLPGGVTAGVVDVPGHEDLVRTMLAGAAGIDLVLLVVAADEGIMPQTREHLAIVEQLRIPAGIPVLTKTDLVGSERVSVLELEVAEWLRGSPVAFSGPVAVSTRTGSGIEALRQRIPEWASDCNLESRPGRAGDDLPRLPIDRAFSLPGAGTIVTGTAWSGTFRVADQVRILPGGERARIRALQQHGNPVTSSGPGERIAVALAGIDRHGVKRGQVLVGDADPWAASRVLDARLQLLPGASRPLSHRARVRIHLGTLEVLARVSLQAPIASGQTGNARLVLEQPAVARGGDRLVLRSCSPVAVIGGGWVLDPQPPAGRPVWSAGLVSDFLTDRIGALLARRPHGIALPLLPVLLGAPPSAIPELVHSPLIDRIGDTIVGSAAVLQAEAVVLAAVRAHQEHRPADPGMALETLREGLRRNGPAGALAIDRLLARGSLVSNHGVIHEPGFRAGAGGEAILERIVAAIDGAGLSPPSVQELEQAMGPEGVADTLRLAARSGRLVAVQRDRYFGRAALDGFVAALSEIAGRGPITPAELRNATGSSRKFLIPLLEWADRTGLTIRRGEGRIPGPALGVATRHET